MNVKSDRTASFFSSREYSHTSSSGTSTPFPRTGDATPQEDDTTLVASSRNGSPTALSGIDDKLKRRKSYGRSKIRLPNLGRLPVSEGITKEHSEKGRVKPVVYRKYIEACSKSGFAMFLIATALSQACSILSNFALRSWSENNRQAGENGGITKYLALSGVAQLLSVLFLVISMIALLLLCALRSSKRLHEDVSGQISSPTLLEADTDRGFVKMLNSLMHAPLSFFEQTPTGRYMVTIALLRTTEIQAFLQDPEHFLEGYLQH